MSSHREAPEISKDPAADNADVYAFVSPDKPGHGHADQQLRAAPGPARRAELLRVRRRRPVLDLHRQRRRRQAGDLLRVPVLRRRLRDPNTFLYNTGPITSLDSANWNKRQFYSVTRVEGDGHDRLRHRDHGRQAPHAPRLKTRVLGRDLACPPCNIGPRSTPNYAGARAGRGAQPRRRDQGVRRAAPGRLLRRPRVDLRPRRPAPVPEPAPDPDAGGRRASTRPTTLNIHTIAIQVPISELTKNGSMPTNAMSSSARDRRLERREPSQGADDRQGATTSASESGPWVQVSRLGNPLFNEVVDPARPEGQVEHALSGGRQGVRLARRAPGAGGAAAGAVPGRVPEPRGAERSRAPTSWRSC